jgi:hypothetical protein
MPMSDPKTTDLLARIAAAVGRIEAVANTPKPPASPTANGALQDLEARHALLRSEANGALSALNAIIEQAK